MPTDFSLAPLQGAHTVAKALWLSGVVGPKPSAQFPSEPPTTWVGMALTNQNVPHTPEHPEFPGTLAFCWAASGDGRGLAGRRGAGGWGLGAAYSLSPSGDHGFLRLAGGKAGHRTSGWLRSQHRGWPRATCVCGNFPPQLRPPREACTAACRREGVVSSWPGPWLPHVRPSASSSEPTRRQDPPNPLAATYHLQRELVHTHAHATRRGLSPTSSRPGSRWKLPTPGLWGGARRGGAAFPLGGLLKDPSSPTPTPSARSLAHQEPQL